MLQFGRRPNPVIGIANQDKHNYTVNEESSRRRGIKEPLGDAKRRRNLIHLPDRARGANQDGKLTVRLQTCGVRIELAKLVASDAAV